MTWLLNRFLLRLAGAATTRPFVTLMIAATAVALSVTPAAAFNETGGSGLIRTEQAYSLPIGRPLFSVYAGTFSNNFTPGTSRMISLTPSVTLGLGAGFEASTAMSLEGLTSSLEGGAFDRRFDFRRRALQSKVRWTSDLGSPRLRAGVMGHITLPLWIDERPGGLVSPETNHDVGVMGLLSANLGWFDVPVRLHMNAGYWRSRDDGAFIYRGLPTSIPVTGVAADRNNVAEYGLALEAGLRRAVVFVELRTEQFVDAREALTSRENLWQVTPGFRTQLSSTVGLTGGVTFDLSSDNESTTFDPAVAYPEVELKLGLTIGSVLSRERHEEARRTHRNPVVLAGDKAAASQGSWLVPEEPSVETAAEPVVEPVVEPVAAPVATALPVPVEQVVTAPVAAPMPVVSDAMRIRELEDRLARLETAQRMAFLEARLAALEGRPVTAAPPVQAPMPVVVEPAAAPVAPVVPTASAVESKTKNEPTVPSEPAAEAKPAASSEPVAQGEPVALIEPVTPIEPVTLIEPVAQSEPMAGVEVAAAIAPAAKAVESAQAPVEDPVVTATPQPAVLPEVQAQLDYLMQEIQVMRDEKAALQAAAGTPTAALVEPPAAVTPPSGSTGSTVALRDRATVITTGGRTAAQPVVTIPVATNRAANPGAQQAASPEAGSPAMSGLLPELREPFRPADQTPVVPAVNTEVVAVTAAPVAAEVVAVPSFGLEVGTSRQLTAVDASLGAPLASPAAQTELDALAVQLAAFPAVNVALLVHGGGADRAEALVATDRLAALVRDYLVAAGAPSASVLPIGMGWSEHEVPMVEIERIR